MCGILVALWNEGSEPRDRRQWALDWAKGAIERRGPDSTLAVAPSDGPVVVCATVLRMRVSDGWAQPACDEATGCVVAWNGEWFSGEGAPESSECDTIGVLNLVAAVAGGVRCAHDARERISIALSNRVRGPFALVAWLPAARCLIFGRDPLGRRSLLLTRRRERFALASIKPSRWTSAEGEWSEVSTAGLGAARLDEAGNVETLQDAPWPRLPLLEAIDWPGASAPRRWQHDEEASVDGESTSRRRAAADLLREVLSEAVRRRTADAPSPVAILFSGGIDSSVLAALCHRHVPPTEPIELLNVAFGANGPREASGAPDRLAARAALEELVAASPGRDWRLVEVCVDAASLEKSAKHVLMLSEPSRSHMDFNIAAALRHGAHGRGILYNGDAVSMDGSQLRYGDEHLVYRPQRTARRCGVTDAGKPRPCTNMTHPRCVRELCGNCCRRRAAGDQSCSVHPRRLGADEKALRSAASPQSPTPTAHPVSPTFVLDERGFLADNALYISKARVLLMGMGADELLAGYARHRTAWRRGGAQELRRELDLDFGRIAMRNLGRDDRVIADSGKEARYPFLDEDVITLIRTKLRLADIADFNKPPGVGCKLVLRDVAISLGLKKCARLQKRAIQFGTRIASHANKCAFGSNRKAAGSAPFNLATLIAPSLSVPEDVKC